MKAHRKRSAKEPLRPRVPIDMCSDNIYNKFITIFTIYLVCIFVLNNFLTFANSFIRSDETTWIGREGLPLISIMIFIFCFSTQPKLYDSPYEPSKIEDSGVYDETFPPLLSGETDYAQIRSSQTDPLTQGTSDHDVASDKDSGSTEV